MHRHNTRYKTALQLRGLLIDYRNQDFDTKVTLGDKPV